MQERSRNDTTAENIVVLSQRSEHYVLVGRHRLRRPVQSHAIFRHCFYPISGNWIGHELTGRGAKLPTASVAAIRVGIRQELQESACVETDVLGC